MFVTLHHSLTVKIENNGILSNVSNIALLAFPRRGGSFNYEAESRVLLVHRV